MAKNRFLPFLSRRRVSQTRALLESVVSALETPYALKCFYALQEAYSGHYHELLLPDPDSYSDWRAFKHDYLCYNVFRKAEFFTFRNANRKKKALEKFLDSEVTCERTNARFAGGCLPKISYETQEESAIIFMARRKISQTLGRFSWDLASRHFRLGPGATFSGTARERDAYYKLGMKPSTTPACYQAALAALRSCQPWLFHLMGKYQVGSDAVLQKVLGNRVATVPKDSNVDRTIAVEPLMNLWVQFGVGGLMRQRLRTVGINLKDQTTNQRLAQEGSAKGTLATIDLSSASDTIAYNLVEALLPEDWFEAIRICRSPKGVLPDGTVVTYQKVSSMGCGFTFELESLIFWALAQACADYHSCFGRVSVYGDDIIVPVEIYDSTLRVLEYCGFSANKKKSFGAGPFRESCGKHYFRGYDVTPFYVKQEIDSDFQITRFVNRVYEFSARGFPWGRDGTYFPVWNQGFRALGRYVQQTAAFPLLGDVGVWKDFDEARPSYNPDMQCLQAKTLQTLFRRERPCELEFLLRGLYSLHRRGMGDSDDLVINSVPGKPVGCKLKMQAVQQWPSVGPWYN